ncbi:MAG: NAD(P)H-hydrate dehydratase [Bacillota bacterium]|nr:NAD(P)H-hydrate dehydratase [Bacillota bacterium]
MYVVTGEEMARIDRGAIERYGIPSLILMENAGGKVSEVIVSIAEEENIKKIVIVAGKGNNGGDGLVIARHLANKGLDVKLFLLGNAEQLKGDPLINLEILKKLKVPIIPINNDRDLNKLRIALVYADLIVDAIYGTGFKGAALGLSQQVIELLNRSAVKILAVDIPSGIEASTGKVHGACIKAWKTITFAFPKIGLFLNQAEDYVGEITVVDISIPNWLPKEENIKRWAITEEYIKRIMPKRQLESHKGSYGHVLIISGAPGMTGAAFLASEGALTSGAGLVTLGIPSSLNNIMEQKLTEVMTKPMPETAAGTLSLAALDTIAALSEKMSVMVIGPGLSQEPETQQLVCQLVERATIPLIIDADGLNALAANLDVFTRINVPCLITPHPGELSRLLGKPVEQIQGNRLEAALEAAVKLGVTVTLKGNKTIIATPDGEAWLNLTGNPGLATGGTGDVLTGIIGGLVAQGLKVKKAGILGVYLHGQTGDEISADKGMMGLKASDLLEYLPRVLKRLEES